MIEDAVCQIINTQSTTATVIVIVTTVTTELMNFQENCMQIFHIHHTVDSPEELSVLGNSALN